MSVRVSIGRFAFHAPVDLDLKDRFRPFPSCRAGIQIATHNPFNVWRRESAPTRLGTRFLKILVDENIDQTFLEFVSGHVVDMGWQGTVNGKLLSKAQEAGFQFFIAADKNMSYQQSLKGRPLSLFVLNIQSNILVHQAACILIIEEQIKNCEPGNVYLIPGPHSKRRSS